VQRKSVTLKELVEGEGTVRVALGPGGVGPIEDQALGGAECVDDLALGPVETQRDELFFNAVSNGTSGLPE
jgi:hypothetical protein